MILDTNRFLACVLWLFLSGRRRVCMGWGSYEPRRAPQLQQHRHEQPSRHLFQNGRRPPSSSALWTTRLYVHGVIASPLCANSSSPSSSSSSPVMAPIQGAANDDDRSLDLSLNDRIDNQALSKLFRSLRQVNGKQDNESCLLQFQTSKDGIRGLHVTRLVHEGETVLAVPLHPPTRPGSASAPAHASQSTSSSWFGCLEDRRPPIWLPTHVQEDSRKWATRLAASWLDLFLGRQEKRRQQSGGVPSNDDDDAFAQWLTLLPEREHLRATLPVHWSEGTLRNAKCTSLELAVDSAFFTRAEAMEDLMEGLKSSPYIDNASGKSDGPWDSASLNHLCEYALDLVQTRSCRLESAVGEVVTGISNNGSDQVQSTCVRVLAPVFDFINHGGKKAANAYFELKRRHPTTNKDDKNRDLVTSNDFLVVKALRDIHSGTELLIDYGTSATWPSWKCLFSYGFIPHYKDMGDSQKEGADENDCESNKDEAEVYVAGIRYAVSADTVPLEMVATAAGYSEPPSEDSMVNMELSPEIATRLANRMSVAAYNLLLEADDNYDELDDKTSLLVANQLATSLRWSQHCILLACAHGLSKYAKSSLDETTG